MTDPYIITQAEEDAEYHFNAQYDYVREAFGGQVDAKYEQECYEEEMDEYWFACGCGMVPFETFDYSEIPF